MKSLCNVARDAPRAHPVPIDNGSHHGVAEDSFLSLSVKLDRFLLGDPISFPNEFLHELLCDWMVQAQKIREWLPHQFLRSCAPVHSRNGVLTLGHYSAFAAPRELPPGRPVAGHLRASYSA